MDIITKEKDLKKLKVVFLAKYAPTFASENIPSGIQDISYARYHHRIYDILKSIFPDLLSYKESDFLLNNKEEINYIFSLYNRMNFKNSEIFISSLAEYKKIAYLGATPNIRATAEDKHLAKLLAHKLNIPTPEWETYNINSNLISPKFKGPYFIKPRFGASSMYIEELSICNTWEEAKKRIRHLWIHNEDVILEEQIDGIYHTSPVLGNFGSPMLLPVIEQVSDNTGNVVTYNQKRHISTGLTRCISNNDLIQKQIKYYSGLLFEQIQPLDYTRCDYIVDKVTGIPYFLEFNVCCNLGENSTISQAAAHCNISYIELIKNILLSSLYRQNLIISHFGYKF